MYHELLLYHVVVQCSTVGDIRILPGCIRISPVHYLIGLNLARLMWFRTFIRPDLSTATFLLKAKITFRLQIFISTKSDAKNLQILRFFVNNSCFHA